MTSGKRFVLSVKSLVLDNEGRCLLLKRSMSSKGNPGKWDLPGGKMDDCECFDEALIREVCEETGLDISMTGLVGSAESESETRKIVYLIMESRCLSGSQVRLSDEHDEYAWVERRELGSMDVVPQLRSVVNEYAERGD